MKYSFKFINELNYEKIKNDSAAKMGLLLEEINFLIFKIKISESFRRSIIYFETLDDIQLVVAKLFYGEKIKLSPCLNKFVVDFGSLHEISEQQRLFEEIKAGKHVYEKEINIILSKLLPEIKIEPAKSYITELFPILYKEINILLHFIKNCESAEAANEYFNQLQEIENNISTLVFRGELEVPSFVWEFIGDCDRLDDNYMRNYIFNKIKAINAFLFKGKLLENWKIIMDESVNKISGFLCCFCNATIEQNDLDPLDISIIGFNKLELEPRPSQNFFCHFTCMKSKLHEYFKGYFIEGVFSIDPDDKDE